MYFLHQIRGQGRVCATANKIDGTQNNLIRKTPIPQRFSTKCCTYPFFRFTQKWTLRKGSTP